MIRDIADHTADVLWVGNLSLSEIYFISPAYETVWGRSCSSLYAAPHTWLDAVHPDDRQRIERAFVQQSDVRGHEEEFRIILPDGSIRWILNRSFPALDEAGKACRLAGVAKDITRRKHSDIALHESEKRLQSILDNTTAVMYLKDLEGRYVLVNREWAKRFNVTESWMVGKTDYDVFPQEVADAFLQNDKQVLKENRALEMEEYAPLGGDMRTYISVKFPLADENGDVYGTGGISADISERKRAETELLESRARFSGIVEMAADAIVSINAEQRVVLFNKAAEAMFGITAAEMIGKSIERLMPQRFHASHSRIVAAYCSEEDSAPMHRRAGIFGLRASGEEFPLETSISKQGIGDEVVMTVMMRDLSEQVKAEAQQRKLLKAIGEAGEAIIITDRNAVIEYVNPAFVEITGYSADEAIGNTPALLKSEAQDPHFYEQMWQTITAGSVWHGTLIDRRKDGSFYPALMSVAPIHDDAGAITHFVSLQQDMSEYKKLEDQFLQAQKMEAIGTLVGGIAHDFNNMLAAIQGNLFLAKRKVNDPLAVTENLENMERVSHRAAEIVRQLLTFARKGSVTMHSLPLNAFIKEGLKLAQSAIPDNISTVSDISGQPMVMTGDATQLQQVVMNLINNARDAVEDTENPCINISLTLYEADADFLRKHPDLSEGEFAHLSVADNGSGIPAELLDKVFEPFFTTKSVGKGTGLGLAMAFGAVQRHGGALEVDSAPGEDTTVHVYLPVRHERRQESREVEQQSVAGQGEMILLVDDEVMILGTVGEVLRKLGYRVVERTNGQTALDYYQEHRHEIAIVISDVLMPVLGGIELLQGIRKLESRVPVILMTGYDASGRAEEIEHVEHCTLLDKPVAITELSRLIREMIQSA